MGRVCGEREYRILLADDYALVRAGIRRILEKDPRLTVVKEVADGRELVKAVGAEDVDLVISDIAMPHMTGMEALRRLRSNQVLVPLVFLTSSTSERHLREAVALGAAAYLHKSIDSAEFVDKCWAALSGQARLDDKAAKALIDQWNAADPDRAALTPREKEIVQLVSSGMSNDAIAKLLHLSIKTVEHHRYSILAKLGLHNGVELCRYAIRVGLVDA